MQIKPGLALDEKQKQLVGSRIKIDIDYISYNPDPDKQVLKNNIVHECEVLCITSADNKLSIPYVGKRKRQSFANWFLFVAEERTNLVLLRTLWNDASLRDELCPHLRLNSVQKRDRQDVESLVELGSLDIRSILTRSVKKITHTLVPEKFRLTKNNVKGIFSYPFSVCCETLGVLYVSDIEKGKVFSVCASHYPAEAETVLKSLSNPIALSFHEGVLYVAECSKNRISYKDLAGEKVLNPQSMTVAKLKVALCKLGAEKSEYRCLKKHVLQAMLQDQLQSIRTKTNQNVKDSVCQVIPSKRIIKPSSLCFTKNDILAVSTLLGEVILIKILYDFINISGEVIQLIELPFKSIQSSISCENSFLVSGNAAPGWILWFFLND